MLDQLAQSINPQSEDNPSKPLGALQSGASILAAALKNFPELAESAQFLAEIAGVKAYNGTIEIMGQQVEVVDGIATDEDGNKVYVSPNGEVVADAKGKILGTVENGKFSVLDKQRAAAMEQSKMAERG